MILEILAQVPAEGWGVIFAGGGGVVAGAIKIVVLIKKKFGEQNDKLLQSLASVMGAIVVRESDETVNSTRHLRNMQYERAEEILLEYAETIVSTAPQFIDSLIGDDHICGSRDIWVTMWMNNVKDTFVTDVLKYFGHYIQRNGLDFLPFSEYVEWSRTEVAFGKNGKAGALGSFLKGINRKFTSDKVRCRVKWIEDTIDRKLISDICESVMVECRKLTMEYKDRRKAHETELSSRIKNDIIATKGSL